MGVFQNPRLIEEQPPDGAFVQEPQFRELLRRIVPLEGCFFGPNWRMVVHGIERLPILVTMFQATEGTSARGEGEG